MIRRPPRSTQSRSSAASDVYKRQPPARAGTSRLAEQCARSGGASSSCHTAACDVSFPLRGRLRRTSAHAAEQHGVLPAVLADQPQARALNSGSIFLGMTTSSWTQTGAASNLGCFTGRPVGLSLGPRPVDPPALEDERLIAAAGQSQRSQRRSCCTAPYGLRSNHGKTGIHRALRARDGCRCGRRGPPVLQASLLGAAGSERRDRPGVPGVLPQIPEAFMSAAAATPAHTAPQQRWVTRSSGRGTPEEARRCRTDRPARYPGLTLVPLSGRTRPPRSGRLRSPSHAAGRARAEVRALSLLPLRASATSRRRPMPRWLARRSCLLYTSD